MESRRTIRCRQVSPEYTLIGDVNGKQMLAHTASAEGIAAVENILGNPTHVDYHKIPACVYSFPEIAVVGLTEEEARARGHAVQTGSFLCGQRQSLG